MEASSQSLVAHRTVTEAAVFAFGCLTGDYSRLHFDREFSRSTGAQEPAAHGLLSASWALGALTLHAPQRLALGDPRSCVSELSLRFSQVVSLGDTLALRWSEPDEATTSFEMLNQRGEVATSGRVTISDQALSEPPSVWPAEEWSLPELPEVFYAQDLLEAGPRGESLGRTLSEAESLSFASQVGESNPLYLNEEFAKSSRFGARIVPPMLCFSIAFGDFLRDLLHAPMPDTGFAGHLGDSWRCYAPVLHGDTLRTRHKPLCCRSSTSRPGLSVVHFGLQLLNQRDELVQDGEVVLMVPSRPSPGARSRS